MREDADMFLGIDVHHAVTAIPQYAQSEREEKKGKRDKKLRFIY